MIFVTVQIFAILRMTSILQTLTLFRANYIINCHITF